jgi:hypothetical protein
MIEYFLHLSPVSLTPVANANISANFRKKLKQPKWQRLGGNFFNYLLSPKGGRID